MRWFWFSVAVGAVPLVLNGVLAFLVSKPTNVSLLWDPSVLFGRGELLTLSIGFSATIIGGSVAAEGLSSVFRTSTGGISFVVGILSAGIYGIVLALREIGSDILGDAVAIVSLVPYLVMVMLSGVYIVSSRR